MFIITHNGEHIGPFKTFMGARKWAKANLADVTTPMFGGLTDPSFFEMTNGASTQTASTTTSKNSGAIPMSPQKSPNSKEN